MIKIQYDGDCKGNEYTFYPSENAWYCTTSRVWRHRWIKAYAVKAEKLRKIALQQGYDTHLAWTQACKAEADEAKAVKAKTSSKKVKKSNNSSSFISLF